MTELRDFVYIDEASLSSHLSSLGRGVPAEVVRSEEGEKNKSGQGGLSFMDVGAKGSYEKLDRDAIETTLQVTAPYRFQDLLNVFDEEDIEIHENPDPRSLARGDVVRITGDAIPMSLFKFETAVRAMRELINAQTKQSIEQVGGEQEIGADDLDSLDELQDLLEIFIGNEVPIRIDTGEFQYGASLDRSQMRVLPQKAFLDEDEYVIIGRAKKRIGSSSTWDPAVATSLITQYMDDESASEEMRSGLEEAAGQLNMSMEDSDWELPGHSAVIHPIAVFW